jgi:hypothetical protein
MNRETMGICAFIMSVMIFSSFTPLVYAIQEPKTIELSVEKQVASTCSDDVWFDELSFNEYQKLISQTVKQIDGFGSQALSAEETSLENAGVGTNPDVTNMKHVFLPGVDGKPALLYDVMKKKAVDESTVCYLDNLFSNGRMAYATRLTDSVRYCASGGAEPCERTLLSKDANDVLNASKSLNETTAEEEQKLITNLGKVLPSAVVESSDAKMILNADTNIFFLKTAADFLNFLNVLAPIDTAIAVANGVSMIRAFAPAATGFKSYMTSRIGTGIKGMFERAGIKKLTETMAKDAVQGGVRSGKTGIAEIDLRLAQRAAKEGQSVIEGGRSMMGIGVRVPMYERAYRVLRDFYGKNQMFSYLFRGTQYSQSFFMGMLFLRNVGLAYPSFEMPGVIEFDLNNELSNYALQQRSEPHFVEVKKTSGIPKVAKYLEGIVDKFMSSAFLTDSKQRTELQNKVRNIQDIVFILDQNGIASTTSGTKAANLITPKDGDWSFLTTGYNDNTLIYNFEHPLGYSPKGKSALFTSLRNINVYGISGIPNEFFTTPLDPLLSRARSFRNLMATLTLFGAFPGGGALVAGPAGAAVGAVLMIPAIFLGIRSTFNYKDSLTTGDIVDVTKVDEKQLCKNKFTTGDQAKIAGLKTVRLIMAVCSAAASPTKPTSPGKYSPAVAIGLACDFAQLGLGFWESDVIHDITKDLQNCMDTNYEVLSLKDIPTPQELQNQSNDILKPLKAESMKIFNMLSPDIANQFDSLASNIRLQVMHLQVDAKDNPLTSLIGKELYYVYFKDANVRWFQGPSCNIDLCQQGRNGFNCMTQNGYRLVDADGNPILDGIPQAASLRMNMEEGYMSVVQRVIEVKKKDGELFDIYPDKVTVNNDCFKQSLINLTGASVLSKSEQDSTVGSIFGGLDAIYTPKAQMWFDGNDVAVQFGEETECADGATFAAGEIFRFPNGHLKVYRDANGKVEVIGSDNKMKCSFELGSDGAVGFTNGLIRSGFAQAASGNSQAVDYSNVYHVFIYSLVTAEKEAVTNYGMEACTLPDGTQGFRPAVTMSDPTQQSQWNNILAGICEASVIGTENSSITFNDSMVTVRDPTGVTKTYRILSFDSTCGGYKVVDMNDPNAEETCLNMGMGPQGEPQFKVDAQAPVPLLWANGWGGSFMYDPNSGRISIKNEFPFALNSAFSIYGGGGLGMIMAGLPPWGGKTSGETATTTTTNPLAALPWMPDGYELALFAIALAGGLLFVRIRFRKAKGT